MTDRRTAVTWDDIAAEAFRITVDRAARGVATEEERTLLRKHADTLLADLARYEEVVGELNQANTGLARDLARAETENAELRDALAHCHEREPRQRAEAANERMRALAARWVKAGPPPLGTPVSRWWDARLAELNAALDDPKEQP